MICPIDVIEVMEKMRTLDTIYPNSSARKYNELFIWLGEKVAQQYVQRTGLCLECDSEILQSQYCMMGHWCGELPRR